MNSLLLSFSGFVTQISDFITAKWPQLIAILTSTTTIAFICKYVFKAIFLKIEMKAKKKYETPILEQYNDIKSQNETIKNELREEMNGLFERFVTVVEGKLIQISKNEQKAKQELYHKIIAKAKEDASQILENLETKLEDVKVEENTDEVSNETVSETEEIKETEEIEETEEIIENDNIETDENSEVLTDTSEETSNSNYQVARRVIEG